jgi:DNA-binding HxlR family transcriptional regulator
LERCGVRHFLELERLIPGITRKIFNEMPPHAEYSLTKYGSTLRPLRRTLCDWGSKHEAYVARNGVRSAQKVAEPEPNRMAIAIG